MKFIDEVSIVLASGNGGPGCVSFRKESMVPRGGPDGGDGGRGGHVIFEVDPHLNSLIELHHKKKLTAANGLPGQSRNMSGQDGKDLIIKVPKGTIVKNLNGQIICDLGAEDRYEILTGGIGGKGNVFYKSSVNQAPGVAQKGMPGSEIQVQLELKLLADVGLVGFPNAGKSTLISAISAARPKVADYPFTTLTPNLGVVKIDEGRSFVVADIPGIIEGAHKGVGLGIQFLRHIQRTRVFIHLIDVSGISGRDPYEDYLAINNELKCYDEIHKDEDGFVPLMKREQVVVLNKIDTLDETSLKEIQNKFGNNRIPFLAISAVSRKGLKELLSKVASIVFSNMEEKDGF